MGKKHKRATNFWDEDYDDGTSDSTNLHSLVAEGNSTRLAHLLRKQKELEIDVNEVDEEGRTPLMIACIRGNGQLAEFLLQANANSDLKDHQGYAAIHHATLSSGNKYVGIARSATCLRALQKYRANIDRKTADGRTSVHLAVQFECMDIIMVLRDLGADLNKFSTEGLNAMYYACVNAAKDRSTTGVISIIRLGAKVDSKDPITRKTALHIASEEKLAEICRFLVLSKASVEEKDRQGNTPLHNAVQKGSLDCLKAILQAFVGEQKKSKTKGDAYEKKVAAMKDDANKKKMEGALALTDWRGNTLLHIACSYGYKEVVSYLLSQGAEANFQNRAVADLVRDEVVVDLGPKPRKKKGKEVIDVPVAPRTHKPIHGDEEAGMKTPYHVCCEVGHTHIFKMFVSKGVDTSDRDEFGHTCLHYAAKNNDVECASLQLDNTRSSSGQYRAEPKTKSGWTPLHFAALHDSVHVIVLLLDAKAMPSTPNKEGKTALDFATRDRTVLALKGQLKRVLEGEAREKEARLKAMLDERKKKMMELEKQSEERAARDKLLLTPRSDDDEEEEDPLAKKRKVAAKEVERPGSRASSAKSGTSSHAASRHEGASPRQSEAGSRPGTAGTGSRPGTGASGGRPGTAGTRPITADSDISEKEHPPGHDQPFQRWLWHANKKYRPIVDQKLKPVKDALRPVKDAITPYWEHPGFVKKRKQVKRLLVKAKRKAMGQEPDWESDGASTRAGTASVPASRAASPDPPAGAQGGTKDHRNSLPSIPGAAPNRDVLHVDSRPGTSEPRPIHSSSALKRPGAEGQPDGSKKKVAFGGELDGEGTKLPKVRIPASKK